MIASFAGGTESLTILLFLVFCFDTAGAGAGALIVGVADVADGRGEGAADGRGEEAEAGPSFVLILSLVLVVGRGIGD